MSATNGITTLYFGKRPYDAETARMAAEALRAGGHAVMERHEGGSYIVETNAPRKTALILKQNARVEHERAAKVTK